MGVDEKALGQRLQKARQRAGLTQQELCQKAGLSYSTLAKIERGAIKSPSVFTVALIAETTGSTVEQLLGMKVATPAASQPKKVSKTGVRFVYFDVNNVLLRFYQKAFGEIANECSQPIDVVEALYWRYNDEVSAGKMSLADFNHAFESELGLQNFDWQQHYIANSEPMPGAAELVKWVAQNYDIGLMSNNMPGFIEELRAKKIIPDVEYKAVIDSSQVGCIKPEAEIYEAAERQTGVGAHEILLVDDTRAFLTAADRANWQITWFNELEPSDSIERVKKYLEF